MRARFALAAPLLAIFLATTALAAEKPLRIGVVPGEEATIVAHVREVAAKQDLPLDIVSFDDATRVDAALANGTIDAASFEDEASLVARSARDGYAIESVAATVTLPMAFYSRKLASIASLPRGAIIVVPADAAGTARALILLQNYALITLKDNAGLHPTLADIIGNRFGLKIRRVDRAKLYGALDTASFVAMNADDAARNKLKPGRDSIGIEDARSPYQHVLAVRTRDAKAAWVARLIRVYHSDDVAHFILTQYQDSVRRPW
ncbi:metal ABC transporter substrate-binding protein [Caballeronia hypogeia]|uniref:Metal ABC transporter substrate-binding protein n=1 Tax=Caballeronia hypogeia TaxID=1777140 RepID=A0A158BST6_9BURK|nr:MetQ/NlpA family ABC transporter substrate-binding protein [Caballeronia hypogeia]SAK73179.1 metal ABC transporter substrate-binding protein [Caballeronia hypogeia]